MSDTIYTSLGTSAVVAKYLSASADSVMHKNAAEYRDPSEHKRPLPPHICQLANNVYYHMKRRTQDQSIVYRDCERQVHQNLLELSVSNPGKKGFKLATQVPTSEFILESFGNARTLFNPNTSRFERAEVQRPPPAAGIQDPRLLPHSTSGPAEPLLTPQVAQPILRQLRE
ncbi:myosin head-domain-containing protein [Mycena galericulata]|nr:myosin head-domain-containing protein [Mycena galericulata]